MDYQDSSKVPVGVMGAGSFGTAISNILSENGSKVLLYVRSPEFFKKVSVSRNINGQILNSNIRLTNRMEEIAGECEVIFPLIPSANFREMIIALSHFLRPYHVLIHGIKGFDVNISTKLLSKKNTPISREHVKTISEVISEETPILRSGCLSGPNLAIELAQKKPAASVVASHFDEVISIGQRLLKSDRFMIYGSKDLIGIELCGILKNILALGAGSIHGMGLGENAKSLFISRGLVEMVHIGKALGGNARAFLGLAGVGDIIATCTSQLSRNFTVGHRLAKGEKIDQILASMREVAEGVNTIKIVQQLARTYQVVCPITNTLFKIINGVMTTQQAHTYLMKFPFRVEIDFLNDVGENDITFNH